MWWLRCRAATRCRDARGQGVAGRGRHERRGVAPHSRVCSHAWANIVMPMDVVARLFSLSGMFYSLNCIIEENQGATSSKCPQEGQCTRALPKPPRYSNGIFYPQNQSTHHTRPRFAGAWVAARSSLREPSEEVSGEGHDVALHVVAHLCRPRFPISRSPQRLGCVT